MIRCINAGSPVYNSRFYWSTLSRSWSQWLLLHDCMCTDQTTNMPFKLEKKRTSGSRFPLQVIPKFTPLGWTSTHCPLSLSGLRMIYFPHLRSITVGFDPRERCSREEFHSATTQIFNALVGSSLGSKIGSAAYSRLSSTWWSSENLGRSSLQKC